MSQHKTDEELVEALCQCPVAFSRWYHVKTGNVYVVVCEAIHEATLGALVIYRRLDCLLPTVTWAKPLTEFREKFVPLAAE